MIARFSLALLGLLLVAGPVRADTTQAAGDWDKVSVAPMKTSIYVGTVTLTTGVFQRDGNSFTSTYEAKVWPWFFWSETGRITITLPAADLAKLSRGERVEFTGVAANHRGKPRSVTGRADNANGASGRLKVKIGVDGTELIFNGTYRLDNAVK